MRSPLGSRWIQIPAILIFLLGINAQAKLRYAMPLGVVGGMGAMGDGSTYKSRTMSVFGAHVMPSLVMKNFMIGPMMQLRFMGQATDPIGVSDINLGGYGYDLGFGLGWVAKRFRVRATYDFLGSNWISVKAADGTDSIYRDGSGYNLMVSYKIKPNSKVTLDLLISYHQFLENYISNTTYDLSGSPMKHLFCSLGISFWLASKSN